MVRIAIDIGGTFTDVVAETSEGISSVKVLTTSQAPDVGAMDGLDRILYELSLSYQDISDIVHGTTLVTNALIERRGAKTALVTTAGFRDVLEMRYEKRFVQYALDIEMPTPLVPRTLRLGINERILADGAISVSPQDQEIDNLATHLRAQHVEAVAIGFLHSYKNSEHERYVANRLRKQLGDDVTICQSAEVAGEIREYERFSTVCANAYVRPLMSRYLAQLQSQLQSRGFFGSLLMMLSGGGLTTLDLAMRFPIRLVESGPAGGVALAAHVSREMGSNKTLSLDIGGTTAKICFIENGLPQTTRRFEVARAWRDVKGSGLPVRVPTVELVEIGAGGGSIAGVDSLGRLTVGPKSAGSDPGPAVYGRGGDNATITDAHIAVGNIDANGFAGGMIELTPERAVIAIGKHIQNSMGFDKVETAAAGIIELADETMANAARVHGIELGLDVASFDLLVSGGGGALHAARIAEKLGIRRIIVPQNAGVGSAVGFLRSPVAFESAISITSTIDKVDVANLTNRIADELAYVCEIVGKAVPADCIVTKTKADMRYKGQGLEITLDIEGKVDLAKLKTAFLARYEEQLGFCIPDIPIEIVSISVEAREVRETERAVFPLHTQSATEINRDIYDLKSTNYIDYKVIERTELNGALIDGPAVITEEQTTTLVRPDWSIQQSKVGHLVLERRAS